MTTHSSIQTPLPVPYDPCTADFQAALAAKGDEGDNKFTVAVGSWVRQRAYLLWAVQELGALWRGRWWLVRSCLVWGAHHMTSCLAYGAHSYALCAHVHAGTGLGHPRLPGCCPSSAAGDSPEGVAMWETLALLQERKAPPAPGAANSSFKRASLEEPLLFEGARWQLELSNLTGAIVGLRLNGCSSARCGANGNPTSGGSSGVSGLPWWQWVAGMLRLPGSWFAPERGEGERLDREGGSWASFNAPLALPVYSTYSEDDYQDTIFNQASGLWQTFFKASGRWNCPALHACSACRTSCKAPRTVLNTSLHLAALCSMRTRAAAPAGGSSGILASQTPPVSWAGADL